MLNVIHSKRLILTMKVKIVDDLKVKLSIVYIYEHEKNGSSTSDRFVVITNTEKFQGLDLENTHQESTFKLKFDGQHICQHARVYQHLHREVKPCLNYNRNCSPFISYSISVRPSVRSFVIPSTRTRVRQLARPSVRASVRPSVYSSVHRSVPSSFHLSVGSPVRPSVRLPVHLSVRPTADRFVHSPVHLSVSTSILHSSVCSSVRSSSVHPSVCSSFHPSVRSFILPSVHPSLHLSVSSSDNPGVRSSVRPSVRSSFVRPFVRPSVHPSVRPFNCTRYRYAHCMLTYTVFQICLKIAPNKKIPIKYNGSGLLSAQWYIALIWLWMIWRQATGDKNDIRRSRFWTASPIFTLVTFISSTFSLWWLYPHSFIYLLNLF